MHSGKYILIKGFFFTILILSVYSATGQQMAQYGLYMLDPYSFNPAFGGLNNDLTLTGNFRRQWSEIPGRPSTQYLSAHMPLRELNSGVGLMFTHDELGASKMNAATFSYNYVLPIHFFVSLGGGLGLISRSIDGELLRTPEGNYENTINHNDPNIPVGNSGSTNGILNLGLLTRLNALEIGISAYQTTKFGKRNKDQYYYKPYTHLILYGTYYYEMNENWKLLPSVLIKYDLSTIQSELDIHVYNKNLFGGIGIRGYNKTSVDAIKFILGGRISERIMLSYNFESSISPIKVYSGNTHELLLQYRIKTNFKEREKEKIIYHPRI